MVTARLAVTARTAIPESGTDGDYRCTSHAAACKNAEATGVPHLIRLCCAATRTHAGGGS
ncbi:hypothetical protein PUN4_280161 [Paraburkholderia unamae]|nr:hypothetical protein PUN4_280161 [Paraburkholderia unamae]